MMPKFKTLHEAIADVLKRKRSASFEEIATAIAEENLWKRRSDQAYPDVFQIKLRTIVHKQYKLLFEEVSEGVIKLKNVKQ